MLIVFVLVSTKPGRKENVYSRLKGIPCVEPYMLDPKKTVKFLPESCRCYGSVYDLCVKISTESQGFLDKILDLHFKKNEDVTWFYPLVEELSFRED
jgi:DNA-binding Lrp family transcriptional regulator